VLAVDLGTRGVDGWTQVRFRVFVANENVVETGRTHRAERLIHPETTRPPVSMTEQPPRARRGSADPHETHALKRRLEDHREELRAQLVQTGRNGVELARHHAKRMDDVLAKLCAEASFDRRGGGLLLGAVGGYGRGLLGPHSDVDLCFITSSAPESLSELIDDLLYPLWDAGFSVGHQVLALGEVLATAQSDLATATELLDLRYLAGNRMLLRALRGELYRELFAGAKLDAFIALIEQRAMARHERFGDSVYLLEPDVKNGTGGLRDLDFALWAARARFHTSDLLELSELGIIPAQRAQELARAIDFVWSVRNHLHLLAGRRADRLTFAEQELVARALGYGPALSEGEAPSVQQLGMTVESFMSDYYRHARVIGHVSEQILGHAKRRDGRARPSEEEVAPGIVRCEGGVALADPAALASDPILALKLYAVAVKLAVPVLSRSRDAVSRASLDGVFCERLRNAGEAAQLFVQLVASPRRSPFRQRSILAELHDVGLLLAMIPEFAPVVGRVHHDIYHVYTVDVHSVAAVDRLHAMTRGELAQEHALASRLAAEITNPKMLALATLLHDVGKAIGGHDHAGRGAEMARTILARLGLRDEDVDDACHLILEHLTLYVVAARRDLSDRATIESFACKVRGREGLRDLYLLTLADLSTTSPHAMTKWKAGMMDALFRATDGLLSGTPLTEPPRVARVRARVRELWPSYGDRRGLDEYLESMPERYLLSNSPAEIASHALIATEQRHKTIAATLVPSELADVMELCIVTAGSTRAGLCVVAGDRPGLLAAISAAISASRLCIQAAQVHSRPLANGGVQAVDLFWVHVSKDEAHTLAARMAKLERDLERLLAGRVSPRELLKAPVSRLGIKPLPSVETEVVVEHHASALHTIIEVVTEDRPALLFVLAEALHALGLTIAVAKVTTEGTRAIDVFYVTEQDGTKIAPGVRTQAVREALITAVCPRGAC
jgi:[protein-PII] uridylyltransferase